MKQTRNSPHPFSAAFSLVEVVLALGICSFAMIAVVGMIPVGLSTFKDAMSTTAQAQIVQRLTSEILLTDYSNLQSDTYYYNDQGSPTEVTAPDLAYTARLHKQNIGGSAIVLTSHGSAVVIRIARTHPGQSFSDVENSMPAAIYSYPVLVADNKK